MFDVVMLRLGTSNILNDSRVLREAKSLSTKGKVLIFDLVRGFRRQKLEVGEVQITLLPVYSVSLGKSPMLQLLKYSEYFFVTLVALLQSHIDLIHVHDLPPLPVAWFAAKLKGCKVIYDAHELATEQDGVENAEKAVWRKLERILLRKVDGTIAANESRARIMRLEYGARECPTVIMNIPDKFDVVESDLLREFVRERGAPAGSGSKVVLYQGGLSPERGLEELVSAFVQLPAEYVLVLMGYGSLEDHLRRLIESLGLAQRVFLHPAVPSSGLHPYTCSADAGVITYKNTCRNNYYCAPNKMFEYANAGLPVVGADLPEIRKIVDKYEIGALFDPEDPVSIGKSILSTVGDQAKYSAMKSNTRRVIEDFRWENEERKLLGLYNSVLAGV